MVTVFVWLPRSADTGKNVGHASMLVETHTYISWWPELAVKPFGDYHPHRNRGYDSDRSAEGFDPDFRIPLTGLNESVMLDWWSGFGLISGGVELHGPMLPYNLLSQNCSTVVARGLKVGGGDRFASWYTSRCLVWRPKSVLDYALSIEKGLAKKR